MNDKILQLQKEIELERIRIKNCNHVFGEAYYDSETEMVGYGSVQDGAGSDPHWSYAGYKPVKKDRWARKCEICDKIEYTYTQEPIIKEYKPKFN